MGAASAKRLHGVDRASVGDVHDLEARPARGAMPVVGERIVREVRGAGPGPRDPASHEEGLRGDAKLLAKVRRSPHARAAVAAHATRLGEKLRREGLAKACFADLAARMGALFRRAGGTRAELLLYELANDRELVPQSTVVDTARALLVAGDGMKASTATK